MFTLCMSRGRATSHDVHQLSVENKQVKRGYLLRYKCGLFYTRWCEEYFVLYEDSTLVWFSDKGMHQIRGRIQIGDAPELLAVGEYTRQVPKKPSRFPPACHIGQLIAIGTTDSQRVHWLIAPSIAEVSSWMTAISNTLPPPPHLKVQQQQNKRIKLTASDRVCCNNVQNSYCPAPSTITPAPHREINNYYHNMKKPNYDADYTALSAVAIDWGHGWGWGQSVIAAHACDAAALTSSTLYNCQPLLDYGGVATSGFDEVDWSSFGDFTF